MSEFTFQETMVKVLTDARLRQSLFARDSGALAAQGLASEDVERLLGIDQVRLEAFADMVMAQRLTDILQILPLTSQILGNRLHPIVFEFNQELKPRYSTKQAQALAFAEFLSERFRLQPPDPPYLEDVLRYEKAALELFGKRNEVLRIKDDLTPALDDETARSRIVPLRLDTNVAIELTFDILEIATELKAGRIPTEPARKRQKILLHVDRRGLIEKDEINEMTLAFIEACDGSGSLAQVIDNLADRFQQNSPHLRPEFDRKCVSLCRSLFERLVIGLQV